MNCRSWTLKRWTLLAAALVLLSLVAARFHLKWKVHREIKRLEAAGAMTGFTDILEVVPPIPEEENVVVLLTNAVALLPPPSEEQDGLVPYRSTKRVTLNPGQPWPEAVRAAVAEYLDQRKDGFALVTEALERREARYFSDYNPYAWDFVSVSNAKNVAWNLRMAAEYELEYGRTDAAAVRLIESYQICGSLLHEPLALNQLVATANAAIARPGLEKLLGRGGVSKENLKTLRETVQENLVRMNCSRALEGTRAIIIEVLMNNTASDVESFPAPNSLSERLRSGWHNGRLMARRMAGFTEADLLLFLDTMEKILERTDSLAGMVQLQNDWPQMKSAIEDSFANEITLSELGNTDRILRKFLEFHIQMTSADLALAVEQYRRVHGGELPESLEVLVPEFVEMIALEPYSGEPFELKETDRGYDIGVDAAEFTVVFRGE